MKITDKISKRSGGKHSHTYYTCDVVKNKQHYNLTVPKFEYDLHNIGDSIECKYLNTSNIVLYTYENRAKTALGICFIFMILSIVFIFIEIRKIRKNPVNPVNPVTKTS